MTSKNRVHWPCTLLALTVSFGLLPLAQVLRCNTATVADKYTDRINGYPVPCIAFTIVQPFLPFSYFRCTYELRFSRCSLAGVNRFPHRLLHAITTSLPPWRQYLRSSLHSSCLMPSLPTDLQKCRLYSAATTRATVTQRNHAGTAPCPCDALLTEEHALRLSA